MTARSRARRRGPGEPEPLTAELRGLPDGHGASPFTFELRFSEEIPLSYTTLQNHALGVTNGSVTAVRRVTPGENRAWDVTVTPAAGGGAVTVALPETTDCAAAGAICAADGRRLAAVSATVPETAPAGAAFRVRLVDVPEEHDGESAIVFEVAFTKEPHAGYSYETMRDRTVRVRQGGERLAVTRAKRLDAPNNDRWQITVTPGSKADLTVLIGPFSSCSDAGAVCTAAGEVLANAVSETVLGPPGLSVADARVHEGPGATVDFAVTLARASRATVTVDYATSDGPSPNAATAGEDYESTSGTLAFAPGETEEDGVGAGARRRPRRGRGDVHPHAVEPAGRQCVARRRDGHRHHRELGRDAEGVARALRAHRRRAKSWRRSRGGSRRSRGPGSR